MGKTEAINQSGLHCGARCYDGVTICTTKPLANGRCRLHGGLSTGPRTAEGLNKSRKARYVHGYYSAEAKAQRRESYQMMRELRQGLQELDAL
jgi:hypothetical protein